LNAAVSTLEQQRLNRELFATVKLRGARIVAAPADRPWGHRDFIVADPDSNLVWITRPLAATPR
jgi:uncharacterized glyoxalase superfamily protein PhnB